MKGGGLIDIWIVVEGAFLLEEDTSQATIALFSLGETTVTGGAFLLEKTPMK